MEDLEEERQDGKFRGGEKRWGARGELGEGGEMDDWEEERWRKREEMGRERTTWRRGDGGPGGGVEREVMDGLGEGQFEIVNTSDSSIADVTLVYHLFATADHKLPVIPRPLCCLPYLCLKQENPG